MRYYYLTNMVDKMRMLARLVVILVASCHIALAVIPELDERLLEQRKQGGAWLVEFYAPWCGHCKKLEPIFNQVYLSLRNSAVSVGKLDCTRYSHVASEFGVRGFPTIKFFVGENEYTHKGERSAEDIIEFVNKAKGPAVRHLSSHGQFMEAKERHSVFFMFVGDKDPNGDLYKKYSSIAEELVAQSYFYEGPARILPKAITVESTPTILVFKDKDFFPFKAPKGVATMSSVKGWINGERYPAYPLVLGGNINEMATVGKLLVMFVIDTKNPDRKQENTRIKELGEQLAVKERSTYHSVFQFLWMDDEETANSITMSFLYLPYVLVLDPNSHLYYIPEQLAENLDAELLAKFLEDVKLDKIAPYGGTGFFQRLKRLLFDLLVTVVSVWESSRWLFLLMFGLPTAVISIVCYSLCCIEPMDEEEGSDEEDSEYEEEARLEEKIKEHEKHLKQFVDANKAQPTKHLKED